MQGQSNNKPQAEGFESNPDLLALVSQTSSLFSTPDGKRWLDLATTWFHVKQGVFDPRLQNPELFAAIREGQNMMIRQIRQWIIEYSAYQEIRAAQGKEGGE